MNVFLKGQRIRKSITSLVVDGNVLFTANALDRLHLHLQKIFQRVELKTPAKKDTTKMQKRPTILVVNALDKRSTCLSDCHILGPTSVRSRAEPRGFSSITLGSF